MDDYSKRKKALINELEHLRTKIAELKSINERQEIEIKKQEGKITSSRCVEI